jgi:hypothetical protein
LCIGQKILFKCIEALGPGSGTMVTWGNDPGCDTSMCCS